MRPPLLADAARRLRLAAWWRHLVPPILAAAYLVALLRPAEAVAILVRLPWFLASVVGIAGFGYFLNDACDVAADRRAGKPNAAADLPPMRRAAVLLLLLAVGLTPWLALDPSPLVLALLAVQVGVLAAYSLRPARLKERGAAGVAADALYGHALPLAITLAAFAPAAGLRLAPATVAVALLWSFAAGARNILLHQLDDRKRDRDAGTRTLGGRLPPLVVLSLVNRVLLPVELGALVALAVGLGLGVPLATGLAAFLFFTALKFSAWKLPFLPRRVLRLKFVWFLNDFYEEWAPALLAVALVAAQPAAWPLLVAHLALFPHLPSELGRDLALIRGNLRPAGAH